ncbi:HpcH/HpaI aldolase family protein [Chromobacterium haemolyticum]|uniref:HpcH/HpaI aldolase family protein n=1 Tax=Chromobacterium TaxID=535 RepID=UPI00069459A0|nr:aldolase/citrate lyase family protein [Chromobacterium haemolyticum]
MSLRLQMTNPLKAKLADGKPIIGIWSIIPSPVVAEIMGLSGLDFVILDMEHGIFDLTSLDACVRAVEGAGSAPLVRIPGLNASAAQWALDLGSHGIVVPQIRDVKDAEAVVGMAKYAPAGVRGYNPFTRAANYANPADNRSGKLDNGFSLTTVIIESCSALMDLEEICATPGIDVVYMGIYDLAVTLGCDGDTRHPKVVQIVEEAIARIRAAGKAAGMMVRSEADIERALSLGANVLVYGVDTFLIRQAIEEGAASLVRAIRNREASAASISLRDPT